MKKVFLPFAICFLSIAVASCKGGSKDKSSMYSSSENSDSSFSSSVTIDAGSYAVVKTNSDLSYSMTAGCGTNVNTSTNTVTFNGLLTHGSLNHLEKKVFTPASDGKSIAKGTALGADDFASQMTVTTIGTKTVYTAATFKVTFSVNFGQGEKDKGLYLNNTAGQSEFTVTGSPITATGFRMAFVPDIATTGSTQYAKVFADLQTQGNCKYVAGLDNYVGTEYTTDLMDMNYNAELPGYETARADAITRPDCIGVFKAPAANESPIVSLTFYVVAWFEVTDPNIVNQDSPEKYQTVASKLVFDAIDINAAH